MPSVIRVFVDTEFTDFINCDLISIGLVTESGETFYGENLDYNKGFASEWVKENVLPLCNFDPHGMKRSALSAKLWEWFDTLECEHVIITIDYQSDYDLLVDLLGEPHPKFYPPQNLFNNFLVEAATQAMMMGSDFSAVAKKIRDTFDSEFNQYFIDTKEIQHHALSDACANRRGYLAALAHL